MAAEWKIDGHINLSKVCTDADWHYATVIERLEIAGLDRSDAEAYAGFAFAEHAGRGADRKPADCVTDEQYDRLTIVM